jgi:hypothetical protein
MTSPRHDEHAPNTANEASTWWPRNRRWLVPVLILSPVLLCCLPCGGTFLVARFGIRHSEPYQLTLERIQSDPTVCDALGESIHDVGWLPVASGNDVQNGPIELQIQVAGSRTHGTVLSRTVRRNERWLFTRLEVHPESQSPIVLVAERRSPAAGPGIPGKP